MDKFFRPLSCRQNCWEFVQYGKGRVILYRSEQGFGIGVVIADRRSAKKEHRKCDAPRVAAGPGVEPLGKIQGSRHGVESFVGAYTHKRSAGVGGRRTSEGTPQACLPPIFYSFWWTGSPKRFSKKWWHY
jgi:hypothetical protein